MITSIPTRPRIIGGAVARRTVANATLLDWLPVAVLPPILVADAAVSQAGHPITVINVLATIAACLVLVVWRRVGLPALFLLVTGAVVLVLWQLHPPDTVVLIPMVALFELAKRGDRRRSLWMGVATVPCVIVSIVPFAPGTQLLSLVVRNLALCLLAIAAGDILRTRELSAQRAAAVREEETRRRMGEERLRIAREIHDLVAHAMTAINVQAGVAAHLLERDPGQAYDALRHIKRTSGEALTDLRTTLDVLRDPDQEAPLGPPGGLADLEALTGGARSAGIAVDLQVEPLVDVPAAVQGAGYRIVQEALTNVVRHSGASRAEVSVGREPGALTIEVLDDGRGGSAPVNGSGVGNGVRGMQERATALGGTLEAAPGASGGWRVRARLPVPDQRGVEPVA